MARPIPPDRLAAVIGAAVTVFVAHGYRRAQVQDVADVLGLAKGTLYGYAAGKEALFAAAVRYGDGIEPLPHLDDLPLPPPQGHELARLVTARLAAELPELALTQALARHHPPRDADEAAAELHVIVVDLFERLSRNRVAIKLVDRCAPELPDLGRVWAEGARGTQLAGMEAYLERRAGAGLFRLPGQVAVVARSAVELCVLWAVHCRFDPMPNVAQPTHDDSAVAATLASLISRSLAPTGGS